MTQPIDYASPLPPIPKKSGGKLLGCLVCIAVAAVYFLWVILAGWKSPSNPTIPVSVFYAQAKAGNVSAVTVDGDEIDGTFRRPYSFGAIITTRFRTELPTGTGGNWSFTQWLLDVNPAMSVSAQTSNNFVANVILPFIPWLMILGFIWLLVIRPLRKKNAQPRLPMPVVIVNPEAR